MLVSVVVPAFNRAHSIGRAIGSALAQQLPEGCSLELIIVDDGSSDDLEGALRPFGSSVKCLRHTRNAGAAAARNTGVAAAQGDFVAFLDSDDTWCPEKLLLQLAFMRAHQHLASCTSYYLVRKAGCEFVSPNRDTGSLSLSDMVWGCFVSPGSTLMCSRSVFDDVGLLDTTLPRLEDWDWLMRYARRYQLGFLATPLARIEPSTANVAQKVLFALNVMRSRYASQLIGKDRQHFEAALDVEAAASRYREGSKLAALGLLIRSLLRVPLGNLALASVVHNRFAFVRPAK